MGSKTRVALVLGAIALTVALYLMPSKAPEKSGDAGKETAEIATASGGFSLESFIENTRKEYPPAQMEVINRLDARADQESNPSAEMLDSLARAWDELKQPGIAATYFERKAQADGLERSYIDAAFRYFDAYKAAVDSTEKTAWVQRAIGSYQKVLELNPKNLDAKTDLGVCYAEGTGEPMKGIMLLRDVVKEKPDHENAQLNLGFLSVRSNQYDKAIERFNKVLGINPNRLEVYIYLGETSLSMGNKAKALEYFEKFIKESTDEDMKRQVAEYIKEIKK